MSEQNVLTRILVSAINAPSGDNAQPWEFRIGTDSIHIFNVPGGDPTLYNFKQRGSYVGHGALIENICIIAAAEGYETTVEPFPGPDRCTATIHFKKGASEDSPLAAAIALRSTHRKPYADVVLKEEDRGALHAAVSDPLVRLAITDKRAVRVLGDLAATNERILFEHQPLHFFLFNMIRWSKEEERAKPGLYIETMEFPKPLQFLMRHVLRHWRIVDTLNAIGLSKFISKQSGLNHGSCSAFGAIIIKGYADTDFLAAGRVFERVWLTAVSRGLSIQPVTALPYLMQRIQENEADMFTDEHIRMIRGACSEIGKICGVREGEHIAMLFRIGYDGSPTALSHKLPPVII